MSTRRDILLKARNEVARQQYCTKCNESHQSYDKDDDPLGFGLNEEPDPLTARGAQDAPVRLKQPERHRNFMRDDKRLGYSRVEFLKAIRGKRQDYDKGTPVNPWAICHAAVGAKKTSKFEKCVQAVKAKHHMK